MKGYPTYADSRAYLKQVAVLLEGLPAQTDRFVDTLPERAVRTLGGAAADIADRTLCDRRHSDRTAAASECVPSRRGPVAHSKGKHSNV